MVNRKNRRVSLSLGHLFLLSYLILGSLGYSYLQWAEGQSQVKIWVPSRELPAYALIQPTDLTERTFPTRRIAAETVKEIDKIRDRYTITTLPEDKPIRKNQLGPELTSDRKKLLQNSVLIGIKTTPAMILGGNLQAGNLVDIAIAQEATEKQLNPKLIQFDNTFVFDIKSSSLTTTTASSAPERVVVLAIPAQRQAEFARSIAGKKLLLFRKP
ncbi:SAF domain-containing protein [Acaryochloris sp. CCMEE 5410]|uniref:SAF domain-containing protein n=1 Tax=Acaryochloris sp. CCMEE 5410 TaxID=310037 RepID=UPI0002483CCD|nr:SAF domain-containing protein [Acaryochloris sp. CCMEE 5410]KAI9130024.1 hypothetical protein ON05_030720 [Acaryochloris sp. CCMEE 5410]